MLDVYAFATPNSIKVPIALEELGRDYALHGINVRKGEQKAPDFVALNPNAKVPVLVDGDLVLTESAAILVYLAEKTGKLLPTSGETRARVFEQLFFHASGRGPAFGQAGFSTARQPSSSRSQSSVSRPKRSARWGCSTACSQSIGLSLGTPSLSPTSRISAGCGGASSPGSASTMPLTLPAGTPKWKPILPSSGPSPA